MFFAGMRAPSKNTSQKSAPPCIIVSGRASMPARLHRDQQVGDPGVLGRVGLGAEQAEHHVGLVGLAGPDLLAGDDPLVAHQLGARLQRGEVAAGARLAVALAPGQLPAERRARCTRAAAPRCRTREASGRACACPARSRRAARPRGRTPGGSPSRPSRPARRPRRRRARGTVRCRKPAASARFRQAIACSRSPSRASSPRSGQLSAQNARTSARSFSYFSPNWRFTCAPPIRRGRRSARGAARARRARAGRT